MKTIFNFQTTAAILGFGALFLTACETTDPDHYHGPVEPPVSPTPVETGSNDGPTEIDELPPVLPPQGADTGEDADNLPTLIDPGSRPIPGSPRDFQITAGDRVYFQTDRYNILPEARSILQKQASWLSKYPETQIVIIGNCDERGTREYNLALGARRANSVKEYLVSLGVNPRRLDTISFGKERPIDPGSTEAAWARNRNAHSQVVVGEES